MNNCENCFLYKSGDCNGVSKKCNEYKAAPQISEEEKSYWRKEGDASRYRRKFYWKHTGGYSIQSINY